MGVVKAIGSNKKRQNTEKLPTTYPGGKGASGVYQRLINQIPPHRVYIETHLGSGAVMRHKRQADINIGLEKDPRIVRDWQDHSFARVRCEDAAQFLSDYSFAGDEFVYADPPYLHSTRRSYRAVYAHEYTEAQHVALLDVLEKLPCRVMISGYWSELYARRLAGWRMMSFKARTRSGEWATEWVWMNYPQPHALHDYRYLGDDFREREKIRRRVNRWRAKLEALPLLERKALLIGLGG